LFTHGGEFAPKVLLKTEIDDLVDVYYHKSHGMARLVGI